MTEKELRMWMHRESLDDAWFVSLKDGQVSEKPVPLAQVRSLASTSSANASSVLVLHASQQNKKTPAWVELDLSSPVEKSADAPAQQQSASRSRRRSRRRRGLVFQVLTLLVLIAVGGVVWYFVSLEKPDPHGAGTEMYEEQAVATMLSNLERNLRRNARPEDDGKTPIRTVVSATQRMLMVKNSNLETWPSFNLKIITPDGRTFSCQYNDEIPAYSTLSISMRKIVTKDGQSLNREDLVAGTTIELDIPDYQPWSSKL